MYGVLGLPQTATGDEIKAAFRRLAFHWHPDRCNEPDAAAQFRAIKEAYDVLADHQKRARYEAGLRTVAGTPFRCAMIPPGGPRCAAAGS